MADQQMKITMKYSRKQDGMEWNFVGLKMKMLGFELAKVIERWYKEGHLSSKEYTTLKLNLKCSTDSDE